MADRGKWVLEADSVTKTYPGVTALDAVDLTVAPGEVHGIVGENGAGKSTLMGIVSGARAADSGTVRICGEALSSASPQLARRLGLAIVHQEPALLPDLTVAENMYFGVSEAQRPKIANLTSWAARHLAVWHGEPTIDPTVRVEQLLPEQRFVVEICRALAAEPRVLVLDEPTEHLGGADVERLFATIAERVAAGCSVVYISHRIREIRRIADRITVLRDGRCQGTHEAAELSEADIVNLIVGRDLKTTFPEKGSVLDAGSKRLSVQGLSGANFVATDLRVAAGEVVGLAGIEGNGQREFLRAIAGFGRTAGVIEVDGEPVSAGSTSRTARSGICLVPGDRHREGVITGLGVRENLALRSLRRFSRAGFVSGRRERQFVGRTIDEFAVKTADQDTPIDALSGGNQQKTVLASALSSEPAVLLVDEPTQGVDVGARAEIYQLLRDRARDTGMATVVLSSDATELAGLCDRVVVFSRGQLVEELSGAEVTEENITQGLLTATSERESRKRSSAPVWNWLAADTAPVVLVALALVGLATYAQMLNDLFLAPLNVSSSLALVATLCLVALAQATVMLTGGIDLSVGPLMGFLVVVESFFLVDGTPVVGQLTGWLLLIAIPVAVGVVNWALVDMVRLHPMVATLVTYMALQALSLLLRPVPGGLISAQITDPLSALVGPVPVTFLVAVVLSGTLAWLLVRSKPGIALRAAGSDAERARINGIRPTHVRLAAYVGSSLLVGVASVTLLAQVGSGDPSAGTSYTLASISAVVIGGVSLYGGRGSFAGVLLGALLVQEAASVTTFLNLSTAWQYYLQGLLTIVAVAAYSKSRQRVVVKG
ncbi:ATP-binding cassette domain-containing protein [Saccharopolyspora sp. TS4A08]|uniref:ATP-binding cassette domain-containing protein n=1 Tax=Saccharopolyspora ipomoeae TaxID=3042027 RepID=A0ABT6PQE9_9PSEU|nr:ATP-binding cassette domain-containing protein [Saccharopolyspora sp. TS4A08]MDI2030174.1 ATP-binding cassette domain-containing protein [Saccharopolyspora sp. TS4A08]